MPFELVQVTAAYSNAVLVAILPHISDFAKTLHVSVPVPVTIAQVKHFGCSPRSDHIGGLVTLTNDYSFTFDQGAVVLYRSPSSFYSLQDPDRVSQFYGVVKIGKEEAVKIAHDTLKKLGHSDSTLHLDHAPKVTSPTSTKGKEIPRYLIEWLDPNEAKSPGGIPRERVTVEVDGSTGQILMLGIQSKNVRRPDPKLSVPTPATSKAPETQPQPAGEGRKVSVVGDDFAKAFLNAILPQLSDFVTNAGVDVKIPIEVSDIDLQYYDCGIVGGLPRACVYLKSGDRFWYEHGQVTEFNARDSYRLPEPGKLPGEKPVDRFLGSVQVSPDEALSVVTKALDKLGYSAKIPQLQRRPEIVPPTKQGTNYFARYFFNWWPSGEGFQVAVAEVNATTKTLESLYINDRNHPNVWRESPRFQVGSNANESLQGTAEAGAKRFFGDDANIAIAQSGTISACRVSPIPAPEANASKRISAYPIVSGPLKVDSSMAEALRKILLADEAYSFAKTECTFSPGVALRFLRGKDHVDVLFCFECNEAWCVRNNSVQSAHLLSPGKLIQLTKQIFPRDKEIQKLNEK